MEAPYMQLRVQGGVVCAALRDYDWPELKNEAAPLPAMSAV